MESGRVFLLYEYQQSFLMWVNTYFPEHLTASKRLMCSLERVKPILAVRPS